MSARCWLLLELSTASSPKSTSNNNLHEPFASSYAKPPGFPFPRMTASVCSGGWAAASCRYMPYVKKLST